MRALTEIARRHMAMAMLLLAMCAGSPGIAHAQQAFDTPETAMHAFGDAIATSNDSAVQALLGPGWRSVIPPLGAELRYRFLSAWSQAHAVQMEGADRARITVGNDGWTLPIPLVRSNGRWHFDMRAGQNEMRLRRIGRNELNTIQTMLAVYDAQREYAAGDHGPRGMTIYASRLVSSPGKKDGLYWPSAPGEPVSPLGPAFIDATSKHTAAGGYHGYRYKLLTGQGPAAPGGAYSYQVNGMLFGGFAVLAWPVKYGESGIKSFIVNHDGQVYERDLGADTAAGAAAIDQFDPGPGWTKVPSQASAPLQ
ncbi:MAG: hypothetical protein CL858_34180 [Cupriavidus sp.]|nr:hypothetical protein [Cupriavidus sp.]